MPTHWLIDRRFVVGERVGAGGAGVVFRAVDRRTGGEVAIKVLHHEHAALGAAEEARFEREAAVLAELSHPGIVRHVASGLTDDRRRYLATEWVGGETLKARLQRRGFTVDEAAGLGVALGQALGELHRAGLVHRDVKPSNILFVGDSVDRIKLIDFGIVRRRWQQMTRTGTVLGTPGYMAPEQARAERDVDARADVFSCGCVLYECLTGRPAFRGGDMEAVAAKILLVDPPSVRAHCPEAPGELEHLLARALAKDRASRPADGAALAATLAAIPRVGSETRRPGRVDDDVTVAEGPRAPRAVASAAPSLFVILVAVEHGGPLDEEALRRASVAFAADARVLPFGAAAVLLDDGLRAARLALALRAELPRALIVLASADLLEPALDNAFRELTAESIARAGHFPDPLRNAVRLDQSTAGALGGPFTIAKDAQGIYLSTSD